MGNDKLVLKDGTEIILGSSLGIEALRVEAESKAQAAGLWEKFTRENLEHVTIKDPSEGIIGTYDDLILDHMEGWENPDGTGSISLTFCLRSKTMEELLEERIARLEAGQQIQDEAISDLGQAVSDAAEGGGN